MVVQVLNAWIVEHFQMNHTKLTADFHSFQFGSRFFAGLPTANRNSSLHFERIVSISNQKLDNFLPNAFIDTFL